MVFADKTTREPSDAEPIIASDRSTFMVDNQKLHIPYLKFELGNEDSTIYSADMTLGDIDEEGRFIFFLNPIDLHEIHKPHFTYEGDQGPSHWASLTTDYRACGVGKNQSPIDIRTKESIAADFDDIEFNYTTSALNILNNGHTVQANYDVGSSISINGKTYNLAQFHFHTPSEHQIDGKSSPIEMHLVHVSEEGDLAVVGVLFSEGKENSALQDIVNAIPDSESEEETIENVTVDANNLLPSETLEYRYSGSLTTPPCSEGVKWFVLQNSLEISSAQLSRFQAVLGKNNRPVQKFNAREILLNSQ